MYIEQIYPEVVAKVDTLRERLILEGSSCGLSIEHIKVLISTAPDELLHINAFLDKMTGLWRYEFGKPYDIKGSLIWGTHMWIPVKHLFLTLLCASSYIPENKLAVYMPRLVDIAKHQDVLSEMIPISKINLEASLIDFEVSGLGIGNHTIDWVFKQNNITVLLDVKRRTKDFILQLENSTEKDVMPKPMHESTLLFRDVENKFISQEDSSILQGVWIVTDIKQNESELIKTFNELNEKKAHFAILGDWDSDVYLLTRRGCDRQRLLNLFNINLSERFVFN